MHRDLIQHIPMSLIGLQITEPTALAADRTALGVAPEPGSNLSQSKRTMTNSALRPLTKEEKEHETRVQKTVVCPDPDVRPPHALIYAASGPNAETLRLQLEWKADPLEIDQGGASR